VGEYTKETSSTTYEKAMGMRNTTITTSTLDTSKKEKRTEKVCTHGPMASITRENGTWGRNTGLENGKETEERPT